MNAASQRSLSVTSCVQRRRSFAARWRLGEAVAAGVVACLLFAVLALWTCTSARAAPPGESPERTATNAPAPAQDAADAEPDGDEAKGEPPREPEYVTESLRGKVVWMAEALERRFGIQTDPDADKWLVALETESGQLWPIVKDVRGRGFMKDPRLRNVPLELLVRRYEGSPMIQVIRVYALKQDGKYLLDYWCDICAIPMYELKECECCQGEIRIRLRRVKDEGTAQSD